VTSPPTPDTAGDASGAGQRNSAGDASGAGQRNTAGDPAPQNTGGPVRSRPIAVAAMAAAAVIAVSLDQITKQLVLAYLEHATPVRLLGGAVYFNVTRNSGAAFSLGSRFTPVFPILAMVVAGVIIWLARRLRSVPWGIALGLILGGATGNLIDRLFRDPGPLRGHVVDFISVFDEAGGVWPIFNVADSSLFCGVVLVVLLEFTGRGRDGTRLRKVPDSDRAPA
jgi:signal peptidase II